MRKLIAIRSLSLCQRPGVVGEGEVFSLPDGPELDSVLKLGYAKEPSDFVVPTPVAEVEPPVLAAAPLPEVNPQPQKPLEKRRGLVITRRG